jgi:hypothetical protein
MRRMLRPVTTAMALSAVALAGAPVGTADPSYATPSPTTEATPPTVGGQPDYFGTAPDANGNPACGLAVGWDTFYDGDTGLHGTRVVFDKQPMPPNNHIVVPDAYTVVVETAYGRHFTQEAMVTNGKTAPYDSPVEKDFNFPNVDPSDVREVLMTNSKGTCWVSGNP